MIELSLFKRTLVVILLTVSFFGATLVSAANDNGTAECLQASFRAQLPDGSTVGVNGIELQYNSSGNLAPARITSITVVLKNRNDDLIEGNFDPDDYRVAVSNSPGGWGSPYRIDLDLSLEANWTDTLQTDIVIDRLGTWRYTIETNNATTAYGSGSGCVTEGSNNYVEFEVTAEDPQGRNVLAGNCAELGLNVADSNYYTCSSGGTDAFLGSVGGDYCSTGFSPDVSSCEQGIINGQELPPGYEYCLGCISDTINRVEVGHLEECTNPAQQSDPSLSEIKVCNNSSLRCLPATYNENTYRCLFPSAEIQPIQLDGDCYPTADECRQDSAFMGIVICDATKDPRAYAGICSLGLLACGTNQDCVLPVDEGGLGYPAGTECNTATGQCIPPGEPTNPVEDPDDPSSDPVNNYAYDTPQYGVINCPNVDKQASEQGEDGGWNIVLSTSTTIEGVREFNQCKGCIEDGGTWTGIGCILTTIEGIFNSIIRIVLGVMGGVSLLRLIILGFQYQFAGEEQIKPAVQDILATLGGLLLVIFSVVILRFIGVNLLDIVPPGFF